MFSSNGSQVSGPGEFIENVFSTYLMDLPAGAGNQQIPHGLDFSTYGGLTWVKNRVAGYGHTLGSPSTGTSQMLFTNTIDALTSAASFVSFDSNGTTITRAGGYFGNSNEAVVSWNFREQPKFFDVVTYTGNGTAGRTVAHSLGSAPGCILVKAISGIGAGSEGWRVYHRSQGATKYAMLQSTNAFATASSVWNNTEPTSTEFTVGTDTGANGSGLTFIAYLFAHDAGGFGLTGTDNVISCGSYTGNGSTTGPVVTLGYEPQFLLLKPTSIVDNWSMFDVARGMPVNTGVASDARLRPNDTSIETVTGADILSPTATGFQLTGTNGEQNQNGATYIYIAIRRGPMKVPTVGTNVFSPVSRAGTGATATITSGFPVDLIFAHGRNIGGSDPVWQDRLRGTASQLFSNSTSAQDTRTDVVTSFASNTSITVGADGYNYINTSGYNWINYMMQRAPGFFDVVCYTGTGAAMTVSHNLGAVPELIILKSRNNAESWMVYAAPLGNNKWLALNSTFEADDAGLRWNDTTPTSSVFSVGKFSGTTPYSSGSGYTYVAYLFATCAGVSKVGSYTGTGASQTINCGFTAGARFVLIKRTDSGSTGDWYVWDTVRGIIAGNDPYLLLNSGAVEVTSTDYIDTYSAGFELSSTAPAAINASAGTFIFLAIA